ncbi:putative internal head protein [Escherichia phage vB_EcoM_RZ]|uniref:Internal head protein n=1 Tax=Escherichia phage vB_EcoM_RZ TaxID=2893954 RepID=A0AAE8YIG9_9CAUD|nr:putative internal head protein [Escherichia phage vB_EcoM_RZ]QIN95440.1 hypothetical protein MN01_00060 [Escherichia phage MN01]QMV34063.1 putative internal head protein [Escherichia phage DK-13]UGL59990.1 putative internal head protein [Escherichia phage vB_EcoM_RZ]
MKTYQEFINEAKMHDELPIQSKTFDGTLKDFKKLPNDKLAKLTGSVSETGGKVTFSARGIVNLKKLLKAVGAE